MFLLYVIVIVYSSFIEMQYKVFQNHYIPTSILTGVMGLAIGPQFTNIIPWSQ